MYDGQTALIANYINPIIGDMEVQAVTPRAVDGYIQTLQKTKSVSTKYPFSIKNSARKEPS